MSVGTRIREIRKAKNLTLADVAAKVGMTPAGLSYIERNQRRISVELLENLAKVLQVDVGDFFAPELNKASSQEASTDATA